MTFRRALAALILFGALASPLGARTAHAYSHDATVVVLERVVESLPLPARGTVPPRAIAAALDELVADTELDPERQEAMREGRMGEKGIEGGVVETYVRAECDLRSAWATGDRHTAVRALVQLAQAVCDLADPYRTVTGVQDECEGARAHFTDTFDPASLAQVRLVDRASPQSGAVALLAHEAAAVRGEVEAAYLRGDEGALTRLRNERLSAAATRLAAVVRDAWRPASGPSLQLRIGPNPLRGPATLRFELAAEADVRLELFDLAGRRLHAATFGHRSAGPQQIGLPAVWTEGLAAGMYLARVHAGEQHAEQRFTRLAD